MRLPGGFQDCHLPVCDFKTNFLCFSWSEVNYKNSDFTKEIVTTKKERKSLKVKKDSTDFYSFMIIAFIESDCLHKIGSYIGFSYSAKEKSEKGLAK